MSRRDDNLDRYLSVEHKVEGSGYIQPFGEIPFDDELVGENVYLNIIDNAVDYVYITTPYITITDTMQRSLIFAAERGVDVRLIVPHIGDHYGIPQQVSRTYYDALTEGGVKIYEYTPGFMHAKMLIADGEVSVVSTINMDYRSFYLHFENGVLMFCKDISKDIKKDFDEIISQSQLYEYGDDLGTSFLYRFVGKVLRLFAPLF